VYLGATTKSTARLPHFEQKAARPFGDRQVAAIARGLLAGVDIDMVSAVLAPGAQQ
jgi:hypothetical protein